MDGLPALGIGVIELNFNTEENTLSLTNAEIESKEDKI